MKLKLNPWPPALFLWFAFLIIVCIGFVIKTTKMNNDLVSKDYYARGLDHDAHQIAMSRTKQLENPPRIEMDEVNQRLIIYLPEIAKGAKLDLYRPSDAGLDIHDIVLQDGVPSVLSTQAIHPGHWQAKIAWKDEKHSYFHQEDLFIP
ncbi:FixH family protein [Kiritimatiellaeota bacterium B1221]|nr:FixH family protein [Kiritimatiellaeota bacterium B1221]